MKTDRILEAALSAAEAGVAVVWLQERSKRPVQTNWSTLPRMTPDDIERTYRPGWNVGVRAGKPSEVRPGEYLYAIDLDVHTDDRKLIRNAHSWLDDKLPGWRDCHKVISGSGGESRHIYFRLGKVLPKRVVAVSQETVLVKIEGRDAEKRAWMIEFYGTGAQLVLPPSIHPITGREYRWERDAAF